MKAGRFLLTVVLIFITVSVSAQRKKVDIKGTVVEQDTGIPVEQATVRLLSVKDSTFIGGVASEKNGSFILKSIQAGNYLLHITYIGFEPLYQPLQITGNTNPVNLGKLTLSDGAIALGEAVVVGKAPEVTVRNDTIEYNADSYKVTEGSMLEDLLKKMPGVEVDEEGKVTVNGKEIKKVLVDGKEFFTDDPKLASKNLPSNMVDKIQVLDRLSEMARLTGFDDGDEETVINLTIKPGMKEGWVGNAFAGYGSDERYEGNMMINRMYNNDRYTLLGGFNNTNNMGFSDTGGTMFQGMGGGRGNRGGGGGGGGSWGAGNGITKSGNLGFDFNKEFSKKLTLSGNARFTHSDNDAHSKISQENIKQEAMFEKGESFRNTKNNNVGANFRLEWKPDDKTTLLFRPNFSYSKNEQYLNNHSEEFDVNMDTISIENQISSYKGEGYNLDGRLEFSRRLNENGRILSASLSGGVNDRFQNGKNDVETFYSQQEDEFRDEKIRNDISGYNYRAYLSWVEPIGRNNFVQLTYNFNQQQQKSLKNVYVPDINNNNEYTLIDSVQTQNFKNDFFNQRVSLSFKSIREKFNYTIGFNADPSKSTSKNFIGDSILSTVKQKVVNFSPTAQFRYYFSKQSNLRIDYNGRTTQPSVDQLQNVPDYSNPKNVVIGNPDLKPKYSNNLFVTYQTFKPESQFALRSMLTGGYTVNDIVEYVINDNDGRGKRTTTYKNVNGNYNASAMVMMNSPLKNRKFTFNSMTRVTYSKTNAFIGDKTTDNGGNEIIVDTKNRNTNLFVMERAGLDFRSTYLDIGANGSIQYRQARNSAERDDNNQDVFNYTLGGRTTIYLPANFKIESDINWSTNSGYKDGFDLNEVLWNASASKSFLKGNQATLRIKVYDILKQRSNISRSITANYTRDTEYNTLSSYFMVHLIYRFSIFKGGASMNDMDGGRRGGFRGPGGGPPRNF